jgi:hypothetical protein
LILTDATPSGVRRATDKRAIGRAKAITALECNLSLKGYSITKYKNSKNISCPKKRLERKVHNATVALCVISATYKNPSHRATNKFRSAKMVFLRLFESLRNTIRPTIRTPSIAGIYEIVFSSISLMLYLGV